MGRRRKFPGTNADQIDNHVAAADRGRDRGQVPYISLNRMNLADAAERLEMTRKIGAADRDADAVALLRERLHHVAAEKS